jgi:uncharacterized phage protein (TIGR02220 family)
VNGANGTPKPPTVTGVFLFQKIMSNQREFTGVFIPAHIWVSNEIGPMEKLILGEISALSQKNGWCYATRKHFASWMHCSEANVTYYLTKLLKAGYIEQVERQGAPTLRRVVSEKFYVKQEPVNVVDPYPSNVFTPTRKEALPPGSNDFTPLNTSINTSSNTSNKQKEVSASAQSFESKISVVKKNFTTQSDNDSTFDVEEKKEKKEPSIGRGAVTTEMPKVIEVVDHMNNVGSTKFRANTGNTAKMILARFKEGYAMDDFKKVIDTRFRVWNGTDMMQHFCPQTLFRPNNFEKYLQNAKFAKPKASAGIGEGSDYSNWDESKKPF